MKRFFAFTGSRVGRKVFVQLVVLAFVPIGTMAYLGIDQVTEELERQSFSRLRAGAKDLSMRVAERLRRAEFDLELLEDEILLSVARVSGDLNERTPASLAENFESCSVHLAQGTIRILGEALEVPELSEQERAHLARGGMAALVRPGKDEEPALLALRSFESPELGPGTVIGLLRKESLVPAELAMQSFALLHGVAVLLTSNPELFSAGTVARPLAGRQDEHLVLEGLEGKYFGVQQTLFLHPQYGLNLTLVYAEPVKATMAPVAYFRRVFLLGWVLTFLIVLLLSLDRIKKTLVPLSLLQEGTRRMKSGDLDARITIEGEDEFVQVGESFNQMAESVKQRTLQLEEANAAKDRFLANMSHELRTPLVSILGYAELCKDPDQRETKLEEHVAIIQASGNHLLRIISDILDLARIESGNLRCERERCDPTVLLNEAVAMLAVTSREKGLELSQRVLAPVPRSIWTDPTRVKQVLLNLLSNAIKFTERGRVTVEMGLEEHEGARRLTFRVHDTGQGLGPRALAGLFEPFVRADDAMNRKVGGTGLGLALSRSIARLLGGDLTCETSTGQGSTFTFTLALGELEGVEFADSLAAPVPSASPVAAASETPVIEPGTSGHVLIAEDVAINRRLAVRLFRRAGFEVDEAEDGQVALEKALKRRYAIVFMDIQMPVMDGYEATRRLRAAGYAGPIVALTAHAITGERERCVEAGCDEFLTKPIDPSQLREVVARVTARAREAQDAA